MTTERSAVWPIAFLVTVCAGAAGGLLASKVLWNYYWTIPTVSLEGLEPKAAVMVSNGDGWRVMPREHRDRALASDGQRCSRKGEVCTYGRPLRRWDADALTKLPVLESDDALERLASARALCPVDFLRPSGLGVGAGMIVDLGDGMTLVAFHTGELRDDTYGYVEVLFQGRGTSTVRKGVASYYFDMAGLEFLTPPVLVCLGVLLVLVVGGIAVATARGYRFWSVSRSRSARTR
jgi:hypothetical protein